MLLKNRFAMEAPESFLSSFWPTLAEKLDGAPPGEDKPSNGGGSAARGGELVFKTSPAMQMLSIPETRPAAAQATPVVQAAPTHPWRWPLTFLVAVGMGVGGFLYYQKTSAPVSSGVTVASAASETRETPAATPAAASPAAPVATEVRDDAGTGQLAVASAAGASGTESASAPGASADEKTRSARVARRAKEKGDKEEVASAAAPKTEEKPAAPEGKTEAPAKPAAGKGDALDDLIDKATAGGAAPVVKKAAAPAEPASDLPEQLTMNEIRSSMNRIKGNVQACYDQYQVEGEARVSFTINNDGSVGDCGIKGKFFGTDTGTCVVSAVKKAKFPKFKGKAIAIPNYPFILQ